MKTILTTILVGLFSLLSITTFAEEKEYNNLIPSARVVVDYGDTFNSKRPTTLIFYALPNGNIIEWTMGKKTAPQDDWHFDIQHIKAQTEYIRATNPHCNYIVAYLYSTTKAWTSHAATYNSNLLYPRLVQKVEKEVQKCVGKKIDNIILSSHSGGGRFIFDYIKGVKKIPAKIKIISFLDSNYGFEDSLHTAKLLKFANKKENKLVVISYIDTTVILNGKRIVSSKGGTGYKTLQMAECFNRELKEQGKPLIQFTSDTTFKRFQTPLKNIDMWRKENPQGKIYHTVLVEKCGFIYSVLGTNFWFEERKPYQKYIK